ncbi:alpha/beta fold hydrolase [Mycobacterium shigaense]|uniref:Epoxide hydrolase A n=1 Tax=Mycobacterium shigaense TaxID=722731 RepID=A0A1Z4EJ43_9MYCO|nr:alpha/beta hydrolase [Mycobacterium shigaense]MEA1124058.1 alpha/beta hydrolase [Mycobacterium shigaense]PRI13787.1 epoxide hydrolase [Mycobacterium shigaense]BAX92926.1 epoxide hydrolase A [Mycobacterium shigaense]
MKRKSTLLKQRLVDTNGVRLRVFEAGPLDGPAVVLAHGFPSLGYSWRRILPVLAAAGYHVLAPDQRGYGGSSCPDDVDSYDITALTTDLVGLLDNIGAKRAVWIGHDLGGMVAWAAAHLHPDRVAGVVGLNFPPSPRGKLPTTQALRKMVGDSFLYMLYFQQPGPADAELDHDPAQALRRIMSFDLQSLTDPDAATRMIAPGPMGFVDRLPEPGHPPAWLDDGEFTYYVDEFTRTGFTGALNWYRNFDRNWEILANPASATVAAPALVIIGTNDPTQGFTPRNRATQVATGPYHEVTLDGAGHWLQEERAADVSTELLHFLAAVPGYQTNHGPSKVTDPLP